MRSKFNPFTGKIDFTGDETEEVLSGSGDPNGSASGAVGQLYQNTDNDDWYLCTGGTNWNRLQASPILTEMYVDGDSGDDSNDGSSWANAKKTFSFLRSNSSDAIPREISTDLTVNIRGTVLSSDANYHLVVDGFYGNGKIKLQGESQDEVVGLTPTGWENSKSSEYYAQYIDVSGAEWTVDEHKGRFIVFTDGTSEEWFPITSNTATRLESIGLPDLTGTETFKIASITSIVKAAQVSDPSTILMYPDYGMGGFEFNCFCPIEVEKLDFLSSIGSNYFSCCQGSSRKELNFTHVSWVNMTLEKSLLRSWYFTNTSCLMFNCYVELDTSQSITGRYYSDVYIMTVCVSSSDGEGNYLRATGYSHLYSRRVRVDAGRGGFWIDSNSSANLASIVLENLSRTGVGGDLGARIMMISDYFGPYVFRNNNTAINTTGNVLYIQYDLNILGSGNTYDVKYQNDPIRSATFADLASNERIFNASIGTGIMYRDGSGIPVAKSEYLNSTSGLTATTFQDAIDEIVKIVENLDIDTGTEVVDTIPDTEGDSVAWHYVIKSNAGTDFQAGILIAVWDSTTDTVEKATLSTTPDIGDTSDVTLDVDIDSNNVRLIATAASDNWTVRARRTKII